MFKGMWNSLSTKSGSAQKGGRHFLAVRSGLVLCVLLPLAQGAHAQTALQPYQEYDKKIRASELVSPLKADLFGESISLYDQRTRTTISITSGATRASPMQIRVSMTAGEARANLADNGFEWKGSETTPGAGAMTKGNVTYKFSPTSNSTGLPSATVVVDGKRAAKLRFDEK